MPRGADAAESLGGGEEEEEEEASEVDEEDDADSDIDNDMLQEACLPVLGEPLPPSDEPPEDANEYLRRVQWERMHCPQVVTADVQEKPTGTRKKGVANRNAGILPCFVEAEVLPELQYSAEWSEDVCAFFRTLRGHCEARRGEGAAGRKPKGPSYEAWAE